MKAWRSNSFSKLIYVICNFQYNAFRWRNCWSRCCDFTIYCTINFIANVKLSLPVIRASNQERKQNKLHCHNTTFLNWLVMSLKGLWHRSAHVRHFDFWTGEPQIKSWLSVKKVCSSILMRVFPHSNNCLPLYIIKCLPPYIITKRLD